MGEKMIHRVAEEVEYNDKKSALGEIIDEPIQAQAIKKIAIMKSIPYQTLIRH